VDITKTLQFLAHQPLLALAVGAIFVVTLGGMLRGPLPFIGGLLRGIGNLGLVAALLLTIVQVTRFTQGTDLSLPQLGMPEQKVLGGETRIPMSRDGHFWLRAKVNDAPARFLIDTGATVTALSPDTANAANLKPQPLRESVVLKTANGAIEAKIGTIDELRFGNIVARDLDAVIAPGLGNTNVIGMNLLSRLASWRVENNTLILVPHHPQSGPQPGPQPGPQSGPQTS
jgi:aspartyl protease family protein